MSLPCSELKGDEHACTPPHVGKDLRSFAYREQRKKLPGVILKKGDIVSFTKTRETSDCHMGAYSSRCRGTALIPRAREE